MTDRFTALHIEHHVGRFVGGNGVSITDGQVVIAFGGNTDGVIIAWRQILEHKYTVVVVVGRIGVYQSATLIEVNNGTINGRIGVNCSAGIGVEAVLQTVDGVFHATHNIALVLATDTEVISGTSCQAYAFLTAIVTVQGTMTGRLVGVKISLNEETRNAMLECSQIAIVGLSRSTVGGIAATTIEGHITADDHVGLAPIA